MEELLRNGQRIAGILTIKKSSRPTGERFESIDFVTDTPITPTSSDSDILVTSAGDIPVNVFLVERGTHARAFITHNPAVSTATH